MSQFVEKENQMLSSNSFKFKTRLGGPVRLGAMVESIINPQPEPEVEEILGQKLPTRLEKFRAISAEEVYLKSVELKYCNKI